jgi:soluble lytic murein transglycosylase
MLLGLILPAGGADAQDLPALLHAGNWPMAYAAAAELPDPVARKLVLFSRLLTSRAGGAAEIAAFLAANPDWPLRAMLARRRDEAIAAEQDDALALTACDGARPALALPQARLRCAEAEAHAGRQADADALIRATWIEGPADPVWEARMMQAHAAVIGREDQWRRFDRLAWGDAAAAKRQEARLDAADKPLAEARLALKRDDASALALVAALPEARRADPALVLEQAKWLRRAGQDDDALALWRSAGAAAELAAQQASLSEHAAAFWDERNLLARRRLRAGDAAGAYELAAGHGPGSAEQVADAEFLAGFLALRRLNDPASAARHFQILAGVSKAAITLGRAHYWLGKAAAAQGDTTGAAREFAAAAAFPTTYYGQLAALAMGEDAPHLLARLRATHDPEADPAAALALAGHELARAAGYLVIWGERGRAQSFMLRLQEMSPDGPDQALLARLATGLDMPQLAVAMARRAGRDGVALIETGWPMPYEVPPIPGVDPALALAVMRQESGFDSAALSPVGARGLMQLMPATAAATARQSGIALPPASLGPALVNDPRLNIQLGTTYLRGLLDQFGGAVPLAVGAYNAGPNRVQDWLAANGDPRVTGGASGAAGADVIDWIELIPFSETRNYVQRVIENQVIYRAKRGESETHPLAPFLART